ESAAEESVSAPVQSQVESKTAGPAITALPRPERTSRVPTAAIAVVAVVLGLYALLVVGWLLDSMAHRGEAMRGVRMAGVAVNGSNEDALGDVLDTLDAELEAEDLTVTVDEVEIDTDPLTLGIRHDRTPMIDEALDARRGGFIAVRPIRWFFNLFSTQEIPARFTIDEAVTAAGAEAVISPALRLPVEPEMELRGARMALVPGTDGVAIDPDEIVDLLPGVVDGTGPYDLALTSQTAEPDLTDDAVTAIVDEINQQTEQPILAQVLDKQAEVSPRTLKSWMVLGVDDDGDPEWSLDEDLALEDLKPLFPALGSEDQQARFSVVDGEPIIIPASETVICCEPATLTSLAAAVTRRIPDPIDPPEDAPDDAEPTQPLRRARLEPTITGNDEGVAELEALGIIEEVSTFTTPHACCQNRVINIQRFADLMQGVVIRPGEEFSLNEFVGRRTVEKGFVADGAIVLGNFEPQVGGGISQYATTFFNASFFAGIEFLEYQSHSIYISRYPRGREATISWRRPDLKVLNNTDYGILVWNEYTDTSITVTFYSTKNREVEALPLLRSSDRQCRIDITPRVITFPDGTSAEDSVRAIYRPGEGLDCNGNSTTPEEDEEEPTQGGNSTPEPPPEPEPEPDPGDGDDGDGGDGDGDPDEVLPPGG
ncbi:MAG: VanW family protein, partial [Actinomycetota bacterium]